MILLRKPVAGLNDRGLSRFLARICRAAKLRGTVNVLVTGSKELRALNLRFLGKDAQTDVLSFSPMPGFVNGFAGDIAISAEIAGQNARLLRHSTAEEIKILALHGVLHLAGYDHEHDRGEMARKEASLRRSLGLPVGLTERNGQPSKSGLKRTSGLKSTKSSKKASRQKAAGKLARPAPRTQ
jgi:probable rRNA maturation factor